MYKMSNKNWTIIHQDCFASLYRYLEEELNMDVRYDGFIETYKCKLMSTFENAKNQMILIIQLELRKIGYSWLLDI